MVILRRINGVNGVNGLNDSNVVEAPHIFIGILISVIITDCFVHIEISILPVVRKY